MGRVCQRHQQFVQDGEECNYCESPARQPSLPTPITKVPLDEVGQRFKTPIDMGYERLNHFLDERFRGPLGESYPEWKARTAAGRLNMAQELLAPKDEDGAPLPPLVTVDEAKKLLDLPESPLRPLYLDAEAQKFQQALLDHIEQLKRLVLAAFAIPPRRPFDILREVCDEYSREIEGVHFHLEPRELRSLDAWEVSVAAFRGGRGGHCVATISAMSVCRFPRDEKAVRSAIICELEKAAAAARKELFLYEQKSVAAMEATPPSTREDAHGDQKGTRPR